MYEILTKLFALVMTVNFFMGSIGTSIALKSNPYVEKHFGNVGAAIAMIWIVLIGGLILGQMTNKERTGTIYFYTFFLFTFILLVINAHLFSKKDKIQEDEEKNKEKTRLNVNLVIANLAINAFLFVGFLIGISKGIYDYRRLRNNAFR